MFDEPYTNIIHICLWLNANNVNGSYFFRCCWLSIHRFLQFLSLFNGTKLRFLYSFESNRIEIGFLSFSFRKDFLCFYRLGFSFITKSPKQGKIKGKKIRISEAWIGIIHIFRMTWVSIHGNWSNCVDTTKPNQAKPGQANAISLTIRSKQLHLMRLLFQWHNFL